MTYQMDYACICQVGRVRANNEDNFWCCGLRLPAENTGLKGVATGSIPLKKLPALAVFDGMGGESSGEVAACLASEKFGEYCMAHKHRLKKDEKGFWEEACLSMNEAVASYGRENRISSMGTTAAMAVFTPETAYFANLGDSRIYQKGEASMVQISTDHVMGKGPFGKAPLTQYLGTLEEETALEPSMVSLPVQAGSRYLLCTDGVTDMLTQKELWEILSCEASVGEAAAELLERAMQKGGRDNLTAILCQVEEKNEKFLWPWQKKS
ncbi:MAG: protein phosphatase 2C domain-containing protein [Eubacteriales bacterium]|nr:protein phosphatase 2C domain-containing protein [Eubacteriales bacterium]